VKAKTSGKLETLSSVQLWSKWKIFVQFWVTSNSFIPIWIIYNHYI